LAQEGGNGCPTFQLDNRTKQSSLNQAPEFWRINQAILLCQIKSSQARGWSFVGLIDAIYAIHNAANVLLYIDRTHRDGGCATFRNVRGALSPNKAHHVPRHNSLHPLLWVFSLHTLMTMLLLLMPSKTHVLSTGTYCSVITLMISCETIPPVNAPILCNSAPPARTLAFD
jgi:hypothetical protein